MMEEKENAEGVTEGQPASIDKMPVIPAKRMGISRDNVDLILFAREKKWSYLIPSNTPHLADRLRVIKITGITKRKEGEEDNFDHLVGEINGTRYNVGMAARPELEYQIVGVGAKSLIKKEEEPEEVVVAKGKKGKKAKAAAAAAAKANAAKKKKKAEVEIPSDQSEGQGIKVIFDTIKQTYIIHEDVEDQLILLFRNDPVAALKVDSAYLKYFDLEVNCMNSMRSRLWRRYVRKHLQEKIWNEQRWAELCMRFTQHRKKLEEAQKLLSAADLSSSDSEGEDALGKDKATAPATMKGPKTRKTKSKDGSGSESESDAKRSLKSGKVSTKK